MRTDGRTADQPRPVSITPDYMPTAEGSALIEVGNTKIICTASVDDGVPAFMARQWQRLGHRGVCHAASRHDN